jgi:hypothetical protein
MKHPLWLKVLIGTLIDFPPDERGWEIVERWYRMRKGSRIGVEVVSW